MKLLFKVLTLCAFMQSLAVSAVVLYEQEEPAGSSAWCTPCTNTFRVWDGFDLAYDADITSIDALLYSSNDTSGYNGDVEYSIWSADRTTQVFSQTFSWLDLLTNNVASTKWEVSATLSGLNLSAGSYALSIFGLNNQDTLAWWQSANTVNGRSYQSDGGSGGGRDMIFAVNGEQASVPEPGALVLFGLGLLGLGIQRKQANKKSRLLV